MVRVAVPAFLLSLASAPAAAHVMDGHALEAQCFSEANIARMACMGFIEGVAETARVLAGPDGPPVCLPAEMADIRAMESVRAFLRAHPERLAEPGARLVLEALSATFPCRGQ